jgi:hemolysin III
MGTVPGARPQAGTVPLAALPKPKFRGWLHAGAAPLVLAAGIVLTALAPTPAARTASAVYAATGLLLFAVSAVYHRGSWSPAVEMVLKRLDHANIMLAIAGTYTPLAWALLPPPEAALLLRAIWCGALAGVLFRLLWLDAPRWLYVPVYCVLGLSGVLYLPAFAAASIPATVLVCAGGAFYLAGAVVYGTRKPRLSAAWFGFHELFHSFTVVAFGCHFAAVLLAVSAAA